MNKKFIFSAFFVFMTFLSATFASQTSAQVVVNEVYGGGGNTGAQYNADFIELYCNGTVACDLNGYSLQYANASGGFGGFSNAIVLNNSTITAGGYYLIQIGSAGNAGVAITANQTVTGSLANTGGNVILVNGTHP